MNVGLKFLLTGGQWFAAILPERDALAIIDQWHGHKCQPGHVFGGRQQKWAVKADQVVAMHLIDLQAEAKAQQAQQQEVPNYHPYGVNPSRS